MTRRAGEQFLGVLMVALLLIVLAGCGSTSTTASTGGSPTTAAASGKTIKVGVLNPTTGAQTHEGTSVNAGVKLYFDSIENQVAGRPIELIFEDDASKPDQGLDRARKLVERDNVNVLMGVVNSGVALGVASYAAEKQTPYILTVPHVNALTGPDRKPYIFRTAETSTQRSVAPAYFLAKKLGLKKAAVFSWDFVVGKEMSGDFAKAFESFGGKVVYNIATPLGTQDYGPFLSKIDKSQVDCIYSFYATPDSIRFVQQLKQFGFTPGLPVVENGTLTEEGVLPQEGDAAVSIYSVTSYSNSIDTPENKTFMDLYAKANKGEKPNWYVYQGYLGAMVLTAGIEGVQGNIEDKPAFLKALGAVKMNVPGGPFAFDDKGQSILDQYSMQVVKGADGTLMHKLLGDKYPAVSQSWTPPAQ